MRFEGELLRPGKDGTCELEHLEALLNRDGLSAGVRQEITARLDGPPPPDALWYLWGWYLELAQARGEGMSGPAPLSYTDVESWARLTHRQPHPFEVQALFAVDATMRSASRPPRS